MVSRTQPRDQTTANQGTPPGAGADVNRELVAQILDVLNGGPSSVTDEIVAAGYIEHAIAPFGTAAPGRVHGPTHVRATVAWLRGQFPDLVLSTLAMVAQGDLVAVRVRAEGTNSGAIQGVAPATGRRFSAEQSHWYRIEDGRLAEHWATRDDLRAMLDLGLVRGGGGAHGTPTGRPATIEPAGGPDRPTTDGR